MSKLLYVESSPRKERASSIAIAREFLAAYREVRPADEVETLDLWKLSLPEFDGATISAKYTILGGAPPDAAEAEAWGAVVRTFERFNAGDRYLFSLPMWNFGVPYKLKHFIDVITQPGLAFRAVPGKGLEGLVSGRPAVVVYARGSRYADGPASGDFQASYFEYWLRFVGFSDVRSIVIEPTLGRPESVEKVRSAASELARKIAREL